MGESRRDDIDRIPMSGPHRDHHGDTANDSDSSHAFVDFDRKAAEDYDAWYQSPSGRRMGDEEEALLANLLGKYPPLHTVLEVGCGTGHFTRWFADRGLSVVGLDVNVAMLTTAQEQQGGPQYLWGNAESLPLADHCIDLVALITSLEFVADPVAALREAARVARVGLLLGVLNLASPLGIERKLKSWVTPSAYRHAHFFTPWGLKHFVQQALPGRVQAIHSRTTIWPAWAPAPVRKFPFGGFIGLAVVLQQPHRGG